MYFGDESSMCGPIRGSLLKRAALLAPPPYCLERQLTNTLPLPQWDIHEPLPIVITRQVSAVVCFLNWKHAPVFAPLKYHVVVSEDNAFVTTKTLSTMRLRVRVNPGRHYNVHIKALNKFGVLVAQGNTFFKAVFSPLEMSDLYHRAVRTCIGPPMQPVSLFYRCKPKMYFDFVGPLMCTYIKDNNGQPASPINGSLFGLFFSAKTEPDGSLPSVSCFGDTRISIPALSLFNPLVHNLYFADFYCFNSVHYVTVVLCPKQSLSDKMCSLSLVPLDSFNNPFLKVSVPPFGLLPQLWLNNSKLAHVEIFITEDVPLCWGRFDQVRPVGAGSSRPGGLNNNKVCTVCNQYPVLPPMGKSLSALVPVPILKESQTNDKDKKEVEKEDRNSCNA